MAHFQMDSEGRNGESIVTWTLYRDDMLVSFGKDYLITYDIVDTIAVDTDTFSDYPNGEPRFTIAQCRAERAKQKAYFKRGADK